jgi:DNA-binding transcriptional LysR family regulator
MDLRQLRALVAIARTGSFTGAARSLRVAQPALSQRLRALEVELGVVLVERGNRTTGLTEAGTRLLGRAERILAEVQDAALEMTAHAGLQRGTVRLGCALQTLVEGRLAPLLARFHERHPALRMVLREVHTEQVFELLRRAEVDLGLVHLGRSGSGPAIGAEAASSDLVLLRLYREPLVLLVAPGHRLADRKSARLEDIAGEDFISFRPGATIRQLVTAAAAERGVVLRVAFSTTNMGTVRAVVSAGLGVAIVPRSAAEVPGPPLRALALLAPRLERVVTLVRNKARYESPAVAALRQAIARDLGDSDRAGPQAPAATASTSTR